MINYLIPKFPLTLYLLQNKFWLKLHENVIGLKYLYVMINIEQKLVI
jgi:hypothetical protein